jgi:uncharacterized protein with WD repeat
VQKKQFSYIIPEITLTFSYFFQSTPLTYFDGGNRATLFFFYVIKTTTGSKVFEASLEGFIQFQWRPRPATLLKDKDTKEIKKNMKSYTRDFEIKDKLSQSKASKVS